MGSLHTTELNYIRQGVQMLNFANVEGLSDAKIAAISPADIATLRSTIENIATAHGTEKDFLLRHISQFVQKLYDLTRPMATPVTPSGGNFTTAQTGGAIADGGSVYARVSAIDRFGNESLAGPEQSVATPGNTGNDNTVTLKNMAAVDGAASYRIYVSKTSATYTGYQTATLAELEGASGKTITDLSANVAGSLPTVNNAKTAALSTTEIAAAISTGTFASLLSKITGEDSTVDSTLNRTRFVTR